MAYYITSWLFTKLDDFFHKKNIFCWYTTVEKQQLDFFSITEPWAFLSEAAVFSQERLLYCTYSLYRLSFFKCIHLNNHTYCIFAQGHSSNKIVWFGNEGLFKVQRPFVVINHFSFDNKWHQKIQRPPITYHGCMLNHVNFLPLWQYRLGSFQGRDTKQERFL